MARLLDWPCDQPRQSTFSAFGGQRLCRRLAGAALAAQASSDKPNDAAKKAGAEAVSNGDNGAPKGRELEFADLLRYIKNAGITNTVWLT
ncbi:hypothetical protein EN851_35355, partial [Mesorhizobium sp. M8A.F.Ca.ET.208.01.1.1]|uniref:hypothetical protein n=1 Tax=Mesorhizobium sp. M8A.F.Ca.ET.208.01.1.1 TaxID=2563969 RepID=UPI001093DDF5